MLPQPVFKLGEEFQCILAQNLPADLAGVFFHQVPTHYLFGQHFRQGPASELSRAVNPFGVIAVGSLKDTV